MLNCNGCTCPTNEEIHNRRNPKFLTGQAGAGLSKILASIGYVQAVDLASSDSGTH